MKHIKLFEQLSSELPRVFTTEEIKNMTQDEFLKVMDMYYNENNTEQAHTLFNIWTKSHGGLKELKNDQGFVMQLGKYEDFWSKWVEKSDQEQDFRSKLKFEKNKEEEELQNAKARWNNWLYIMGQRGNKLENAYKLFRADLEKLKSEGPSALNSVPPTMKNQWEEWSNRR